MIDLTHDAIQVLLDRAGGEGMIVSCYANTSVTEGFESLWLQHLTNEAKALEERLANDHEAQTRFARDLDVIRHALDRPATRQARGMALFSAADRGLFRAFSLGVPVDDRLVLDEEPYLVPLLEAMHRQRRYLVVVTDSHQGRLYEAAWGHTHLLREIVEAVPRRQRSAGERWGKQQATIARHREDHLQRYRKALMAAIEDAWPDAPFRGLILLGDHGTISSVREALPAAMRDRVVHSGACSWATREPTIDNAIQQVLDDALRAHDATLVEEFERHLREHYLIAAGPQEVLNALHNGQVGYPGFVILEPDRGEMGARCTRCGSVFTTVPAVCAFCQGACGRVNARHNITAHTISSHPGLRQHGGIAAVLSRQEPWEPAAGVGAATSVRS